MTKARQLVNKAVRFEQQLNDLQWKIYQFQDQLEGFGLNHLAEKAGNSAFEMDVSKSEMKEIAENIEAAYCNKQTLKQKP